MGMGSTEWPTVREILAELLTSFEPEVIEALRGVIDHGLPTFEGTAAYSHLSVEAQSVVIAFKQERAA